MTKASDIYIIFSCGRFVFASVVDDYVVLVDGEEVFRSYHKRRTECHFASLVKADNVARGIA